MNTNERKYTLFNREGRRGAEVAEKMINLNRFLRALRASASSAIKPTTRSCLHSLYSRSSAFICGKKTTAFY